MQTTYPSTTEKIAAAQESTAPQQNEIVDLLEHWTRLQPRWDQFVAEHPRGSIFNTSSMVRVFLATKGNKPLALASVRPDGRIAALFVSIRVQTLPPPLGRLSSRAIFYAEPLCGDDPDSMAALSQLIARHDANMRRSVLFAEVRPLFAPGNERIVLERAGYKLYEYLNFLFDVTQPVDVIWSKLHRSVRRAVRQCEDRGLTVCEVPVEGAVEQLYSLLKLSYRRSGVPLVHRSLFEATARELYPQGVAKFFAVHDGSTPVAMDVLLTFGNQIYSWYGGVCRSAAGSPGSLLRWYELKWAHEHGFAIYDGGGAGRPNVPYSVRDFKAKFGGDLVQFGRYQKVYCPWKLALAERVYKLKNARWFHENRNGGN